MTEERLATILSSFGLSPSQLAQKLGVQRSGISHILSGRNRPGLDFIVKLLQVFPQIDADWLLSGKGKMLKASPVDKGHQVQEALTFPDPPVVEKSVPLIVESQQNPVASRKMTENTKPGSLKGNPAQSGGITLDKKAEKVIVLYRDGTYEEFVAAKNSAV